LSDGLGFFPFNINSRNLKLKCCGVRPDWYAERFSSPRFFGSFFIDWKNEQEP